MRHECKITVLETKCFPDLQEKYLANPKSGPCPFFKPGDTFLLKRTPQQDDFYHLMNGKFCGEAPNKFRSGISFGRGQPVCVHSPSRGIHHEGLHKGLKGVM